MAGSVPEAADLVVSDPVQAGVMAVMAVAETARFSLVTGAARSWRVGKLAAGPEAEPPPETSSCPCERRDDAFVALGPVRYVRQTGERPMGLTWKCQRASKPYQLGH
jgi:hypothetical protein